MWRESETIGMEVVVVVGESVLVGTVVPVVAMTAVEIEESTVWLSWRTSHINAIGLRPTAF